jgi:muramoyltetrapeptide carboxypeptidase LdcA involved in peptidoglycan recycling
MPRKSDILLHCDILALEDDDEDDEVDFSLDQLKEKGFAMGYNAFAIGSHKLDFDDKNFVPEDISYAYFFKLKKTTRTPFTAPLPEGVSRLFFYALE